MEDNFSKVSILKLFASSGYITVNKYFIKAFGLEESVVLGELLSLYTYWEKRNKLTSDGYFFCTIDQMYENTGLTAYKQRRAIISLNELGLLEYRKVGIPAKRYIKLNTKEIYDCILKFEPTIMNEPIEEELPQETIIKPKKKSLKVTEYDDIINEVLDYLNTKTGNNYRKTTASYKKLIIEKLKQEYTIDDFKKVIDNKCSHWLNTDMAIYLRPSTLFGNKFDSYLNEGIKKINQKYETLPKLSELSKTQLNALTKASMGESIDSKLLEGLTFDQANELVTQIRNMNNSGCSYVDEEISDIEFGDN